VAIPTLCIAVVTITRAGDSCGVVETSLNIQSCDCANLAELLEETKIRLADCATKMRFDNRTGNSMETGCPERFVFPADLHYSLTVLNVTHNNLIILL